jgi:hypothetical protein
MLEKSVVSPAERVVIPLVGLASLFGRPCLSTHLTLVCEMVRVPHVLDDGVITGEICTAAVALEFRHVVASVIYMLASRPPPGMEDLPTCAACRAVGNHSRSSYSLTSSGDLSLERV